MSSFRHKSTSPSSLRKIGIDKHHRKNGGGLSRSLHCRGGDCSHEDEIDVLASTFLAAKSTEKKRHTAPRSTNSNKLFLQTPNMSSFRHKSTSLSTSSSSIRKIDIDKHHRKIHGGLSRSPRCQGTLPSSNSEETLNESDDDEILFTTTRRSGGRKSRRKKSNSSNRPSTAQRLGQREMMKSGEKEKSQSRSPPSNKNTQRRGGRRSSTRIERELRSFEKTIAGVGQRNNSVTTSPVLKNGYESSGELSRSTCQSTNIDDDKKRDTSIIISPVNIGIIDKSEDINEQKRNSDCKRFQQQFQKHNGVGIAPRSAFLLRSQSVNALNSIRRVPLTNNPTSKTPLIDSKKKSITSRLFKGFNSVTMTDGKPVPAVQNSTDQSTSATTMVLPDITKSEMRFAPQKQQQQQQQPSPVLKNGYESSGELSRSTCQSTNIDDDKKRDTSIIISPVNIGIIDKSEDINEQKRNSDCKRFQQQFQKHNGVGIAPRSAFLLRSQSVNALNSIRRVPLTNNPTSKTPLIDSKKKSITSRLFKGFNSVTMTDGKPVPAVQNSTDQSTSATTMVLPDITKSEMRFAPQKQQQQQQQPSPVLKNGYESSGELSRSTCQSTNIDDDKKRDTSIIISPVIIGIVDKSKDINKQKRNSDCKRFQQQFQKHNGVRIAPRSAFLLRSQSVNALKSIRNSHTSKTPVIDSKKNSIASRLFKGIKHKGKGKDKYKDIDMDRIEEAIIHRDDNTVDECTYDKKYNNKTFTDSRSEIVKKYDDNNERESTCVKLPTNKHQATIKYRSRDSLKKENRETMECGLIMSVTSFSDDVTSDLIDHVGGKDNDTTPPLKEGNPLTLLDSDPKAHKKYGDNLTGNDVESSITAMLEESDEMISMASFSTNDTIDLSAHSGGGNKSSRADTIMNRMDDVNGTTILEEDSFSNDDSCNGDSGDADRANDMTKNEDERKIVQDIVTKEKIVESKCIQIDFSHLSKSGTGDLFLGSIAR